MTVLLRAGDFIEKGHRMTLISPSPYQYYSGMGPGMLSGMFRPQEARFHIRKMVEDRGGVFVAARVVHIDGPKRLLWLSNDAHIPFDVASFNTGSHVPVAWTGGSVERLVPVKPVFNLYLARLELQNLLRRGPLHLVVVGGGAAGVEVAGNLWKLVRDAGAEARITLVAGRGLLRDAPPKVRGLALSSLLRRSLNVIERVHLDSFAGRKVLLSDGSALDCDLAFVAVGVTPSRLFVNSKLPTGHRGELWVDRTLRSPDYPHLLGGGDCIAVEGMRLAKVGVYAVRQNPILHHNLMASLEGKSFRHFGAGPSPMLILNMGDGTGILWKKGFTVAGKMALKLKNFIDFRFMRKFQVSGELEESEALPDHSAIEREPGAGT
ncbi:MAG: FAD-dependent oxidoreductase [Syntrophobacteraceae bacterium]|jgi:NADH dehydrogenase FAD-containing subunit|nr:FAD-dependent oxidoreductase [Syntrophobacteraceae bacterium]